MERKVPVWFLLLVILLGGLFTVMFGWAVKSTLSGSDRSGMLGRSAVLIASFPTTSKAVFLEFASYLTGSFVDETIRVPLMDVDLSGFELVPAADGIDVQGLLMRANRSALTPGWRVLVGSFTIDGEIENAALLFSPDLRIVKSWILTETDVGGTSPRAKQRKFIHGFTILIDASIIFAFDGGVSLQRFDRCGRRLWAIPGKYHHAVTVDDSGSSVWTLKTMPEGVINEAQKSQIVQVAVENGEILRQFSIQDVIDANPEIDNLELLRVHSNDAGGNSRNTSGSWLMNPFHLNDVDPLPAALAEQFEGFEPGDLAISARSINLVLVLDPESLKVKWWRIGATQRQHDADWQPNGEITVYNNRMSRDFSEIVAIDPSTFRKRTIFDGRVNNFYSRMRGKHQLLPTGDLLITSPQQGRIFEVTAGGDIALEIVNKKPGSATLGYTISEAIWLHPDALDLAEDECDN